MARQIDDSQPLSDDDRAWLMSRNDFAEITRIDTLHSGESSVAAPPEPVPAPAATGSEIVRLGDYLNEHFPDEVGENNLQNGEGAVDVAIRLLDRTLDAGEAQPAEDDGIERHEGTAAAGSEGGSDQTPAPQEPVVDGTTAQDLGLDTNPQQVAESTEQRDFSRVDENREAPVQYNEWTVDELKDELANRELSRSGNKQDLIDRLREDDSAR